MARKQSVKNVFHTALKDKIAYGESKHADKQELAFGVSTYKIYSYSTYNTYVKECEQYAKWLIETKGVSKIKDIKETEQYAKEYIQSRLNGGVSVYTAKLERSALGMLYGKQIDVEMPKRDNKAITRSRRECEYEKHISRGGKYKDVFTVAAAAGTRRKDISKLTVNSFFEKDGHMYVKITQSKGGRDRLAPVVPALQAEVKDIIEKAKNEGRDKLFSTIPAKIDIHSLRREYTQSIFKAFAENRDFRDAYLKGAGVPKRHEIKVFKDKEGNTQTREVKAAVYRDRDGNVFDRDDLYAVSQALGHNRLDVSVTHYLKN